MPAFHEGFADIVALFQHFQCRDLARSQIARARGDIGKADLLGGLALQFGEGAGMAGPLRDYLRGDMPDYATATEPHARGELLVLGVYRAFETIFRMRAGDLIRLATGGSGQLAAGEIHPDLATRLADEAVKVAGHVLTMCIRALDYCPPVDITFGSYMRALITADLEIFPEDRRNYRVAFLESFRMLGLLPTNLRTISVETLRWMHPREEAAPDWLGRAVKTLEIDWQRDADRETIFQDSRRRCAALHDCLTKEMAKPGMREAICGLLGLKPDLPRFDAKGAPVPGTATGFEVRTIRRARRILKYGSPEINFVISRPIHDQRRRAAETPFRAAAAPGRRGMYFGRDAMMTREPFAMLHAADETM